MFLGEGHGYPLQYSCLENPMDRNLVGYNPWGHKGLDMTKANEHAHMHKHVPQLYKNGPILTETLFAFITPILLNVFF